jgi:hypothetical protein
MRHPSTIEELLRTLPEAGTECPLYHGLYKVVRALGLEHSERQGMATIAALEQSEVVFDDGRVLGAGPLEVGIEDIWSARIGRRIAQLEFVREVR